MPADFSYTRDVQSPAVQQYYSILQALALNQAEGEWSAERDDTMRPDSEMLERCEKGAMAQFKALVGITDDMQHAPTKVCNTTCYVCAAAALGLLGCTAYSEYLLMCCCYVVPGIAEARCAW